MTHANSTHFRFWDWSSISVIGSLATSSLLRRRGSKQVTVETKCSSLVQPPMIRNTSDRKCCRRGLVRSETTWKKRNWTNLDELEGFSQTQGWFVVTFTPATQPGFSLITKIFMKFGWSGDSSSRSHSRFYLTRILVKACVYTDRPPCEVIAADLLHQRKNLSAAANQCISLHFFHEVRRLQ